MAQRRAVFRVEEVFSMQGGTAPIAPMTITWSKSGALRRGHVLRVQELAHFVVFRQREREEGWKQIKEQVCA